MFRRDADGHRFLLLRAYRNWDFPKGVVDTGEDPLGAAVREAGEEAGLADLRLPLGPAYVETPVYARGKVARFYLAETATERIHLGVSPELGRPEHHEARWLRYGEARALLVPRLQAVLDWAEARHGSGSPG